MAAYFVSPECLLPKSKGRLSKWRLSGARASPDFRPDASASQSLDFQSPDFGLFGKSPDFQSLDFSQSRDFQSLDFFQSPDFGSLDFFWSPDTEHETADRFSDSNALFFLLQ